MEKLFNQYKRRKAMLSFDKRKNQSAHQVTSYRNPQTGPLTSLTLRKVQRCQLEALKGLPKARILPAGREAVSEDAVMSTQKSEVCYC